jgi:hypothetical protein
MTPAVAKGFRRHSFTWSFGFAVFNGIGVWPDLIGLAELFTGSQASLPKSARLSCR